MGGYNSGRHGGRPTVGQSKCITVAQMVGRRRPGATRQGWSGSIDWTHSYTGERTMTLRFSTFISGNGGSVEMDHPGGRYGDKPTLQIYTVELAGLPQPFGGMRWLFVCPLTHNYAQKLFLPLGACMFASRQAYRLGYQSQRETKKDRALNKAWKAKLALGGTRDDGGLGVELGKPKWRHWRTFDRDMAALRVLENDSLRYAIATIAKFGGKNASHALRMMQESYRHGEVLAAEAERLKAVKPVRKAGPRKHPWHQPTVF